MLKNINSITIIINLEGIEEINTDKMTAKHFKEYFFHQRCEKTSTNLEMAFYWLLRSYDYLILTFYYCLFIVISAGYNTF